MSTNKEIITHANPHTIKKFELIEKYVSEWAHKLLNNEYCKGIVFIDCMSNSGEYYDDNNNQVFGTPVRVANLLHSISFKYHQKSIDLFFSDLSKDRTTHLKGLLPQNTPNFHCFVSSEDGNNLAKRIGSSFYKNTHYLLVYDPYVATIDWSAIVPYLNGWSEVIINHMVNDSKRAIKNVKSEKAKSKYENTYLSSIEDLILLEQTKEGFEKRIEDIIQMNHTNSKYKMYIAVFPFFNEKHSLIYNLIHCSSNIEGFKTFKKSAWKTFGGKSSIKDKHGLENQIVLNVENLRNDLTEADDTCFYVKDIAAYIQKNFNGKQGVALDEIWSILDLHPIFPSDGYKSEIKNALKEYFNVEIKKSRLYFEDRSSYNERS